MREREIGFKFDFTEIQRKRKEEKKKTHTQTHTRAKGWPRTHASHYFLGIYVFYMNNPLLLIA